MRSTYLLAVQAAAMLALGTLGCSSDGNGGAPRDAGADGDAPPIVPASCAVDPLKTGLVAEQTGVSVDAFDCAILKWAAAYGEPDPMLFKAVMYVESRFDELAVACTNNPCGVPSGWTTAETGCFGLMQVVPACGPTPNGDGLLPDGHPNLTRDPAAAGWAGSIFNPEVNVEIGIAGLAGNRAQVEKQFPGCTVDQYTLMALGNYADYGSTTGCTAYNASYVELVLPAYRQYAAAAGYPAHAY